MTCDYIVDSFKWPFNYHFYKTVKVEEESIHILAKYTPGINFI